MPDLTEKINFAAPVINLWRGEPDSLEPVAYSANYVFSFIESGKKRYLRLTPGEARTKAQIEAELDFIIYLRRGGVDVSLPAASTAGRLIEEVSFGETAFFACVFEEATGARFSYDSAGDNKEHFRLRGRTLGAIHALSGSYIPSGNFRRFAWNEDNLLLEAERFLAGAETIVRREFLKLKESLAHYPQSNETFGLVHGDFGETNFRVQNERLKVFDFDDCCYHWFLYDLAVTIYPHGWRQEGRQLLDWLLEGYAEKMPLDIKLSDITMFCQWRLIYMFLVYARKWGFNNLTAQQSEWFARKRQNIADGYSWQK